MIFDPGDRALLARSGQSGAAQAHARALRNSIPEKARAARSQKIVDSVLASRAFAQATAIAMFAPMLDRNEVDVRPIRSGGARGGQTGGLPALRKCDRDDAALRRPGHLRRARLTASPNLRIDSPEVPVSAGLLVVVPALRGRSHGASGGDGKGFYDRLLARVAPPAVSLAVAYDFQVVMEIPKGEHYRPVNIVITDVRSWGEV